MRRILRVILFTVLNVLIKKSFFKRIYNWFYNITPYFLIKYLIRHVNIPSKNFNWKIKLENGKTINSKINSKINISKSMALSYRWHNKSINVLENLIISTLNKKINWIDCGSNLGLRSLIALSENIPVFMIEPNSKINKLNRIRCEENSFLNYMIIESGLSNRKGEENFYIDKTSYLSSLEKNSLSDRQISEIKKIKINTLDNLIFKKINPYYHTYLKIDVEGHEFSVLDGAKKIIEDFLPTILIEITNKSDQFYKFIEEMKKKDYQVFEIVEYRHGILNKLNTKTLSGLDFLFIRNEKLLKAVSKYLY